MTYYMTKMKNRKVYEIGTSMEFRWNETVVPTKPQIIQKAI